MTPTREQMREMADVLEDSAPSFHASIGKKAKRLALDAAAMLRAAADALSDPRPGETTGEKCPLCSGHGRFGARGNPQMCSACNGKGKREPAAPSLAQASKLSSGDETRGPLGDVTCKHGVAMDVHCCNCHSGFIFDSDHECLEPGPVGLIGAFKHPKVDYVTLLHEAQGKVRSSVLYERFIDGTPLENDIAVWMANFALDHPASPPRGPQPSSERLDPLQVVGPAPGTMHPVNQPSSEASAPLSVHPSHVMGTQRASKMASCVNCDRPLDWPCDINNQREPREPHAALVKEKASLRFVLDYVAHHLKAAADKDEDAPMSAEMHRLQAYAASSLHAAPITVRAPDDRLLFACHADGRWYDEDGQEWQESGGKWTRLNSSWRFGRACRAALITKGDRA